MKNFLQIKFTQKKNTFTISLQINLPIVIQLITVLAQLVCAVLSKI